LNKSAEWRAKYFAGDTATVNEFNALNAKIAAADPVELAIAGVVPPAEVDENSGAVAGGRELVEGAKHLRESGFSDGNIGEIYRGQLVTDDGRRLSAEETAARVAEAERFTRDATKDPDFRRKFLSGDQASRQLMDRASAIIAAGKKTTP
jgi:hypothetical protein